MRARVRVKQKLVGVEPVAGLRLVGAVNAKAIKRRRPDLGHVAVEHLIGSLGKFEAASFAATLGVEETHLNSPRIRGKDSEVRAFVVRRGAKRIRLAFADLHPVPRAASFGR